MELKDPSDDNNLKSLKIEQWNKESAVVIKTEKFPTDRIQIAKKEKKVYKCEICENSFIDLYQHQKIHSENDYKCEICDKSFAEKGNLKRHKKIHDSSGKSQEKTILRQSQRTYECDICCKTFASSELKKHKIIHSDQKPFQCIACNKFLIPNLLWANMKKYILE